MEKLASILNLSQIVMQYFSLYRFSEIFPQWGGGREGGGQLGRGVQPASQNPHHIYDQNLRFSLSYL